jgi:hypothetical protein
MLWLESCLPHYLRICPCFGSLAQHIQAEVLLEVHNTHYFELFMSEVRQSIQAGQLAAYRAWWQGIAQGPDEGLEAAAARVKRGRTSSDETGAMRQQGKVLKSDGSGAEDAGSEGRDTG